MQKQGYFYISSSNKESKELLPMSKEDFLERFYDGKINYKLPSKYPENFALCTSYNDGKKEIPLLHRDKVGAILKDAYNAVKPIVKKFKLSLALLIESNVTYKGVAWTKRIKIDFSMPGVGGKREELFAYTSMIQIKIRNPDQPQNSKKFMNRTTILAILLHEFAHTRHMNHGIEFALFLKEMFEYAVTLGVFPENEEHMIPSSRAWERRMFETKGSMSREELETFFSEDTGNTNNDHEDDWEQGVKDQDQNKMVEEESKDHEKKENGDKKGVDSKNREQNKAESKKVTQVERKPLARAATTKVEVQKESKMDIENQGKKIGGEQKSREAPKLNVQNRDIKTRIQSKLSGIKAGISRNEVEKKKKGDEKNEKMVVEKINTEKEDAKQMDEANMGIGNQINHLEAV